MALDDGSLLDGLTGSQKTCLRLVHAGQTSKEIARQTGLTPQTVDQYMSRAVALLGAANRYQAAKWLADAEAGPIKVSEFSPQGIAPDPFSTAPMTAPTSGLNVEQSANDDGFERPRNTSTLADLFKLPPVGGKRHELDWVGRTAVVFRVAIAAIVAAAGLVAVTRGAVHLLS
jgi:DNA-binding CsgD family transcriptional regulator